MTDGVAPRAEWQGATIVEVIDRTPTIKSFFLRLSERFTHAAGQHVDVRHTATDGYVAMRSCSSAGHRPLGQAFHDLPAVDNQRAIKYIKDDDWTSRRQALRQRLGLVLFEAVDRQRTTSTDYTTDRQSCHVPAQASDRIYTHGYRPLSR